MVSDHFPEEVAKNQALLLFQFINFGINGFDLLGEGLDFAGVIRLGLGVIE